MRLQSVSVLVAVVLVAAVGSAQAVQWRVPSWRNHPSIFDLGRLAERPFYRPLWSFEPVSRMAEMSPFGGFDLLDSIFDEGLLARHLESLGYQVDRPDCKTTKSNQDTETGDQGQHIGYNQEETGLNTNDASHDDKQGDDDVGRVDDYGDEVEYGWEIYMNPLGQIGWRRKPLKQRDDRQAEQSRDATRQNCEDRRQPPSNQAEDRGETRRTDAQSLHDEHPDQDTARGNPTQSNGRSSGHGPSDDYHRSAPESERPRSEWNADAEHQGHDYPETRRPWNQNQGHPQRTGQTDSRYKPQRSHTGSEQPMNQRSRRSFEQPEQPRGHRSSSEQPEHPRGHRSSSEQPEHPRGHRSSSEQPEHPRGHRSSSEQPEHPRGHRRSSEQYMGDNDNLYTGQQPAADSRPEHRHSPETEQWNHNPRDSIRSSHNQPRRDSRWQFDTHPAGHPSGRHQRAIPQREVVRMELPDYHIGHLQVTVSGQSILVSGRQRCGCDDGCVLREFERVHPLPNDIDAASLTATINENQVLTVHGQRTSPHRNTVDRDVHISGMELLPAPSDSNCAQRKSGIKLGKFDQRTGQTYMPDSQPRRDHVPRRPALDPDNDILIETVDDYHV